MSEPRPSALQLAIRAMGPRRAAEHMEAARNAHLAMLERGGPLDVEWPA